LPKLTVLAFVDRYWHPYQERQANRPSTLRSYESILKNVVAPLAGRTLNQVSSVEIEHVVQKRTRQASPKTVQNEVRLLHSIFHLALEYGLVERNPVRRRHQPRVLSKEKPIWTPAQIQAIIAAFPAEHRPLITTAACTGLRVSELLALTRDDIDLKRQTIRVCKSLDGKHLVRPKTESSNRLLPVGPQLMKVLAQHLERTRPSPEGNWLFPNRHGRCLNADVLRKDVLYPVVDRLQLPRPPRGAGFHCFRHSLGSLVNAQTGNLKLVQDVLGHSRFETTANVYTHTASAQVRAAAQAVEQAILDSRSSSVPKQEYRGRDPRVRCGQAFGAQR
jgi:integrase